MGTDIVVKSDDLLWTPGTDDLGFDGVGPGCVKQGFLKVAQFGSDEVKKGNPKFMSDLEVGHFFCPQRRKSYGESFLAVALKFWQSYAVYDGEGTSSKFKGNITVAEFESRVRPGATRKRSYYLDQSGWRYVDSRNFLVIPYDNPLEVPMIFSLQSTGIPASRDWLTFMEALTVKVKGADGKENEVPVPMRGGVWKLSASYTNDDQGDYYKVNPPIFMGLIDPKIEVGGMTLRERVNGLHKEAKALDFTSFNDSSSDSNEEHTPSSIAKEATSEGVKNVSSVFGGKKEEEIF